MSMDQKREALYSINQYISENSEAFQDLSLDGGKLGLAIYYYFRYKAYGEEESLETARNTVESCINALEDCIINYSNKYLTDSLSNYLSGIGKALLFIEHHLDPEYDFTDIHYSLQELLIELNIQNFENKDFDISSGAMAGGHYFMNHFTYNKDDVSRNHLLEIVSQMQKSALSDDGGKTVYWNSPSLNNKVYIGLSHGSSLIINFLTKLFRLQILDPKNQSDTDLLSKASAFVLDQKRDFKTGYFPTFYPNHEGIITTQLSMCYGDLGVAYVLYQSSLVLSLDQLKSTAFEILSSCARRPLDKLYTFDAGLTYGASGLYVIFEKLIRECGIEDFRHAAGYWADGILQFRDSQKQEYAGFINRFDKNIEDKPFNMSFGWGIIGVAISLMINLDKNLPVIDELTIIGI